MSEPESNQDSLDIPRELQAIEANVRKHLRAGQLKDMLQESKSATERFPFLAMLAVHCHVVGLDFDEAIRIYRESPAAPHPVVIWAIQKEIKNMAPVGEAIFSRIRHHQATLENCLVELAGPDAGMDLSQHKLTYTFVLEKTDQAIQLTKEVDQLRAHFPDWSPDIIVGFSSPELQAFMETSSGTLQ